ncbi:MAG TPA: hypothetical protein DCY94_02400 [Firmicutes bacterium]|nr:hypothetical protein [Bacillota bacterium]
MKITVGISNRHVHLNEETFKYLFEKDSLQVRNELNQIGEFASTDTITLSYKGKKIPHVRIVGPLRAKNQIELLKSDLEFLGLEAPTRRSGDLEDTPSIEMINGEKIVTTDGVIRAERHVHVPTKEMDDLNLHERDIVKVTAPKGTFEANVKVSDNGYFELHIDKDEAEEYGITSGQELDFEKI